VKLSQFNTPLYEAPIGDFETIGLWGNKDRNSRFRIPSDRKLVRSPKLQDSARQQFGKTPFVLNMYFVNLPEINPATFDGVISPERLAEKYPKTWAVLSQKKPKFDDINVIFTGNKGSPRYPLTPWMMAHRLGHAFRQSNVMSNGNNIYSWGEARRELTRVVLGLLDQVYGVRRRSASYSQGREFEFRDVMVGHFLSAIGTMRSARGGKLVDAVEFLYELFAQYVTTGKITFNPLPKYFGKRGGYAARSKVNDHDFDYYGRWLDDLAEILASHFENALAEAQGRYVLV